MPLFHHWWACGIKWFIHKPCACNHMNALFGRVGKCVPRASPAAIRHYLTPLVISLANAVGKHRTIPYYDVYKGMNAKKRARYQRAEEQLKRQGGFVTDKQCHVNMFVKMEAISMAKENPDCRAIQFRSYEYTLQLASKIKLAEHRLYEISDVPGFVPGRLFAKGMTPLEKARRLQQVCKPGWNYLELDASRWDAHLGPELLGEVEHRFWQSTSYGDLRRLLKAQLKNKGSFKVKTQTGTFEQKYEVDGERMSGDANTAGGNCIIMSVLLAAFGNYLEVDFDFLDDGDDSVFAHSGPPVSDQVVVDFFRQFGIVMAIENRPTRLEEVNFCQSKPVFVDGSWTMVRSPIKIMSKIGITSKVTTARARYMKTVALGELSMLRGCPVLQPFLLRVIQQCDLQIRNKKEKLHKGAIADNYRLSQLSPRDWSIGKRPITPAARNSFHLAWGMDVNEQLQLERALERWSFDLGKTRVGEGIDRFNWSFPYLKPEEW